jgi:hypothetical protein
MKLVVTVMVGLVAALAAPGSASAKCGCADWLLTTQVAEGRPSIVLTRSCFDAKKPPAFSIEDASGSTFAVMVDASHAGYRRSIQEVILPLESLAPGTYELVIAKSGSATRLPFTVVAATSSSLAWAAAPNVTGQSQTEFGCGPAKGVTVSVGTTTATLARVELTDDKTQTTSVGFVAVANDALSIGHGMCSGAFELERGRSYTASVSLLSPETGAASTAKSIAFTFKPK